MNAFVAALLVTTAAFAGVAAALKRRTPRLASASLVIAIGFAVLAALEITIGILDLGDRPIDVTYPPGYYTSNPHGIQQPTPGAHRLVATRIKTGAIHYDITCTIDDRGRRVVPGGGGPYREYAAFIGDSFTYGDGVEDDETLPAAFAKRHPDLHVYNYGFHGAGPFDVLARLETTHVRGEIPESTGLVIYTFIDEHVMRTRDFFSGASYRRRKVAYELLDDGTLVQCDTWATCHPLHHRIMCFLGKSNLLRFTQIEFRIPPRRRDFDRATRTICRMNEVVKERWPGADLVVVFYPGCRLAPRLIPALDACGVHTIDLSTAFAGNSPPNVLSVEDPHPNPDAYARVAELIRLQGHTLVDARGPVD